ncbi:hypothetical protein CVT26_010469 [Gymnopilus dilepis]|uniref:Uncharacterized protein n=1 Tax=Gymnopilus dilepis TaxID=231916 RepID=A0A409Y0F5_9AGAR|nr:hypothetical protein CVT26_010469 [Gymnopilus dilepis]
MTSVEQQSGSEDARKGSAGPSGEPSLLSRISHKIHSPSHCAADTELSAINPSEVSNRPGEAPHNGDDAERSLEDPVPGLGSSSDSELKEESNVVVPVTPSSSLQTSQLSARPTSPPADDETSISSSPRSGSPPNGETKLPTQDGKIPAETGVLTPFTPEELQEAKHIVLDLLGWGVPSEYFLTVGISPAALYRIFTDLNLRLPPSFKVSEDLKTSAYKWGPPPDGTSATG